MLQKPDVKTKDGIKTLGVYGIIVLVVGKYFVPDLQEIDILNIVAWWNSNDMSIDKIYDFLVDGTAGAYILNKLRSVDKKGGENETHND